MSNLAKNNIFSAESLYIIKVIVISLILLNFNKTFAEETSIDAEPFEIWGQSTNQSIPQLEDSNLEEENLENEIPDKDSDNLGDIVKSNFNYSIDDTIGLYDESNGGFSPSIWKFSNFEDIEYLITNLPKEISNNELLKFDVEINPANESSDENGKIVAAKKEIKNKDR